MINNFKLIEPMLKFDNEDDFYHLQILKRKKENPEIGSNSYVIKTYYITSVLHLNDKKDEIIHLCDYHNARAYINLNRRSFERIAMHMLKKTVDIIMNKDYKSVRNAYESVCGEYGSGKDKIWIVDIDDKNPETINPVIETIESLEPHNVESKIIGLLPTKNGYHLLTTPFNRADFSKKHSDIDVHNNNPTIVYVS